MTMKMHQLPETPKEFAFHFLHDKLYPIIHELSPKMDGCITLSNLVDGNSTTVPETMEFSHKNSGVLLRIHTNSGHGVTEYEIAYPMTTYVKADFYPEMNYNHNDLRNAIKAFVFATEVHLSMKWIISNHI